jgi:multicomponent K+:H+ antiporter subunit D
VAALFAIMTKVGLYSVLRIQMLWFGDDAGAMAGYGRDWLLWAGVATLVLGGLGALAATRLRVLISYLVIVSAATLFIAFSVGTPQVLSAGLYYLPAQLRGRCAVPGCRPDPPPPWWRQRPQGGGGADAGQETPAVLFLIGGGVGGRPAASVRLPGQGRCWPACRRSTPARSGPRCWSAACW